LKRTPQPTSSERTDARAAKHPRHIFRFSPWLPLICQISRYENNMRITDTLPDEMNGHVISFIINLVCPQCGGRMTEFRCEGGCRRNWLAEWEWANLATRSSRPRLSLDSARSRL
jgi:hypothetical protein